MQTHPPAQILSSSLEDLVKATSTRYENIRTLKASVDMSASTGGGKEGKVVDYTSFTGFILFRKPGDLHFVGLAPAIRTRIVEMVTDGKNFTIVMPPLKQATTGSNSSPGTSTNSLKNLRPQFFTDALLIRSAGPDELVSLVSENRIYQPDPTKKYVVDEPDYDLGIYRTVANSTELKTQRVIHIGRATLLPYQQDVYDEKGQLVTVVNYDDYKLFGDQTFASRITIRRPIDGLTLRVTITELALNATLDDEQFETPRIPDNYKVEKLP